MERQIKPETEITGQTSFGKRIRFIRGNLTQVEFADLMGAHRNTVSGWETGTLTPGCETLVNFMEILNVNLNWLFSGKDEPHLDDDWQEAAPARKAKRLVSQIVLVRRGAGGTRGRRV